MIFKYTIFLALLFIHALWIAWFLLFLLELALLGNVIQESLQWHLCFKNNCNQRFNKIFIWIQWKVKEMSTYPESCPFPLNQISGAASLLWNSVCPSWWSSPFWLCHTPFIFFSHSVQTFQGERPFPLCKTEVPFALPRSPSVQHHHPKKTRMRPTHGQWRHINPHERPSSVNSPLGLLFFAWWVFYHTLSIHDPSVRADKINTQLPHSYLYSIARVFRVTLKTSGRGMPCKQFMQGQWR